MHKCAQIGLVCQRAVGENRAATGAPERAHYSEAWPDVVTATLPVVAPAGTVVEISEGETKVIAAGMPLKVTLVAPVRSFPRISTADRTVP
jgi:hypothetical protein